MYRHRKTGATNSGLKTSFTGSEKQTFSTPDFTTEIGLITPIIEGMMRTGKIIRLFRCFACDRPFPASRMSAALVVCRALSNRLTRQRTHRTAQSR